MCFISLHKTIPMNQNLRYLCSDREEIETFKKIQWNIESPQEKTFRSEY